MKAGQGGRFASERWWLLRTGAGDPAFNMALDAALLEGAASLGNPVLRFYGWTIPAASFGYSQRLALAEQWTALRPLVRRPTGGGVVPHDRDWTYTLVFPAGHGWYGLRARESYELLHAWLQSALERIGVETQLAPTRAAGAPTHCFARAEQSDLLWRGTKMAGAAQRRTKSGLLIQGSIQPPLVVERALWEAAFLECAAEVWGVEWKELELAKGMLERAKVLAAEVYAQGSHLRRR